MSEIYNKNKNLKIFLDMDGTVVECLFDLDESFAKEGGYVVKKPIKPVLEQINKMKSFFSGVEINILSCSRNHLMTKEKNEWLDKNIPYIKNENRIFLDKENEEYANEDRNKVKGNYIKNKILDDEIAILIDEDIKVLREAQEILKEKVVPIHVTSLLI